MPGRRPHLDLSPELCDRCARCEEVCDRDALKIGPSYIYVDWDSCEGCDDCAKACETGAIVRKGTSRPAPTAAVAPAGSANTGVGVSERVRGLFSWSPRTAEVSTPTDSTWSLRESLAVLAVAVALLVAKDAVLSSESVRSMSVNGLVLVRAFVQAVYYGALLGSLAWLVRRRGLDFRKAFGLVGFPVFASAAWIVATLVSLRLLSTMYGAVAQMLGWEPPTTVALTSWFGPDVVGLFLSIVMVVVVGPFVEEIVFRGMLLPALRQAWDTRTAIVLSALAFSASHATPWSFVPTALLGIGLGWIAVSRGSVWPAIALHSLYNAVGVAAIFYVQGAFGG